MERKVTSLPANTTEASVDGDPLDGRLDSLKIDDGAAIDSDENNDSSQAESVAENVFADGNPYGALADLEEEEEQNVPVQEEKKKQQSVEYPAMKELSRINGQINRMKVDKLKKRLRQLNLDASGTKLVLQKRLKNYHRRELLKEPTHYYKYYVIIDFEATCDAPPIPYRHEIIEFPAILVSTKKMKIISKFHSYVRPVVNPKLTMFCTNLTGITQDKVNFAPEFPEVLKNFEAWMKENNLLSDPTSIAIVTDGPWDMGRFLYHQCKISKLTYPPWAKTWINIKKPFCNFYKTDRMTLQQMLSELGMSFIGQPHCGLDDAYNIARVALKMTEDGANMRVNEQINFKKNLVIGQRMITVKNINRGSFNAMIKRRNLDPKRSGARETSNSEDDKEDEDDNQDESVLEDEEMVAAEPDYESEFPSLNSRHPRDSQESPNRTKDSQESKE